jgi:hypothetical protein
MPSANNRSAWLEGPPQLAPLRPMSPVPGGSFSSAPRRRQRNPGQLRCANVWALVIFPPETFSARLASATDARHLRPWLPR